MIDIKKLSKAYGKQVIFTNTNYTFPNYGLICLLGPSGCGKSTLLNLLAGFDCDYQGEIEVGGTAIHNMNANELCAYRRDNIGFVFQNYNLLVGYTVLENIVLPCELHEEQTIASMQKAKQLLERLHMIDKENEKIEHLSGGQKQRVAIARALINDPSILLADEPTGALDRKNATEIMQLLQELSQQRLVIIITHDQKVCKFADHILHIEKGNIVGEPVCKSTATIQLKQKPTTKTSAFARGLKNFKVHLSRYLAIAFAISIGALSFMLSLSSSNIMDSSISTFKNKNTAFNNGYIKVVDNTDDVLTLLQQDSRIENVYKQYILNNVTLSIGEKNETMSEKYPMPKATESMSYGTMPMEGKHEIALNPSLAKKFNPNIDKLIGNTLTLKVDDLEYKLTISGIFNAGYDDFFISSDIEKQLYRNITENTPYSLTYDVINFEDILPVSQRIMDSGITPKTAATEVEALQSTFENLNRLFLVVSILIFSIGLFVSSILLVKLQNSRYRELGLLAAIGFNKHQIRSMIIYENILLSIAAALCNALCISVVYGVSILCSFPISISIAQMITSIIATGIIIILVGLFASYKPLHSEPAVALRK